MKKIPLQQVSIIVLLILILLGNYFLNKNTDNAVVEHTGCQLAVDSCEIVIADSHFEVRIEGEVKALQPFVFRVVDGNHVIEQAVVSFRMKAMAMGVNQYRLLKSEAGWVADIVIPICTTGRRDWLVELEISLNKSTKKVLFDIEI